MKLLFLLAFLPSVCLGWWNSDYTNRRVIFISTDSLDSENLTSVPVPYWWQDSLDATGLDTNRIYIDANDTDTLWGGIEGDSVDWIKIPQIDSTPIADSFFIYYGASSGGLIHNSSEEVFDTANGWVGVWHWDGGSLLDATSNDNDGTNVGADYTSSGKINGAYDFVDANDDYINCGNDASLNITGEITLEAWIKADTEGTRHIFSKRFEAESNYMFRLQGSKMRFGFYNSGFKEPITDNEYLSIGVWQHWAVTFSESTDDVKFYINGDLKETKTETSTMLTNVHDLVLGTYQDGGGQEDFDGIIDEPRISNVIRTPEWMQIQYLAMNNLLLTTGAEESEEVAVKKVITHRRYW